MPKISRTLETRPPTETPGAGSPGRGVLQIQRVEGRSVATRLRANSPLRLLAPRHCPGNAAWVFTSTFGGGLLASDAIELTARIGPDSQCLLATQASTKIYRSIAGRVSRQSLRLTIERDAACIVLPDPLVCFAGARFEQKIDVTLADGATLILLDWLSSGRLARGERWGFDRYRSEIAVTKAEMCRFKDVILLDKSHGPIEDSQRMGRCDCYGTLLLQGSRVESISRTLLSEVAAQPVRARDRLIFAASPVGDGVVLKFAGPSVQSVGQWLRDRLSFIPALLGGDPWARKW